MVYISVIPTTKWSLSKIQDGECTQITCSISKLRNCQYLNYKIVAIQLQNGQNLYYPNYKMVNISIIQTTKWSTSKLQNGRSPTTQWLVSKLHHGHYPN